jgi:hypothetical protein
MFPFFKSKAVKHSDDSAAERAMILEALRDTLQKVSDDNALTRKLFTETFTQLSVDESVKVMNHSGQGDVIPTSESGTDFSIRYRNDTQRNNTEGIHRLEWIAKPTAIDPVTNLEWPDSEWTPVLHGDAVEYSYAPPED